MKALALAVFMTVGLGCGSSPNATFYALAPVSGAAQAGAPHAIKVRRVAIAGYLDRPEIVRRLVDYRLGVAANERWGEPLDAMLGRVVSQDLEARLAGTSVFSEDGAIAVEPDATVEIEVRRFDVDERGELRLAAEVAVERPHESASATHVELSAAPKAGTTAALVAAMSDLVGQLADRIAAMVLAHGGSAR